MVGFVELVQKHERFHESLAEKRDVHGVCWPKLEPLQNRLRNSSLFPRSGLELHICVRAYRVLELSNINVLHRTLVIGEGAVHRNIVDVDVSELGFERRVFGLGEGEVPDDGIICEHLPNTTTAGPEAMKIDAVAHIAQQLISLSLGVVDSHNSLLRPLIDGSKELILTDVTDAA